MPNNARKYFNNIKTNALAAQKRDTIKHQLPHPLMTQETSPKEESIDGQATPLQRNPPPLLPPSPVLDSPSH